MKKLLINPVFLLLLAVFFFTVSSCSKDDTSAIDTNEYGIIDVASIQTQVNDLPQEILSTDEMTTLILMREEEKLARDVYITMYNKWGSTIFSNISSGEQTHMDAILILLNRYSLTDPVGTNVVGVFSNLSLQNLYNNLVAQGNKSLLDAYRVGATIEDLDIFDLENALTSIDNQDIRLVYDNLNKGSRNHLRSYYKNILKVAGAYTPQYLTQAAFDAIIGSAMEKGFKAGWN